MAVKLADELCGNLTEDETQAIIDAHNRELERLENELETQKNRQQEQLLEKLQRRRLARNADLREKHERQVSY